MLPCASPPPLPLARASARRATTSAAGVVGSGGRLPGSRALNGPRWVRWLGLATLASLGALATAAASDQPRGLPFIRSYPFDEIGTVPRSLRLGFDAYGRVAVMYDGVYSVLNDSAWVDRLDSSANSRPHVSTLTVAGGQYYYGGRGSWGVAEPAPDGRLRAVALVPPDAPSWTKITPFNHILKTRTGLYFYELNGMVYWDFARHLNRFLEMPRLSAAFTVGDRVFAACQDRVIREVIPEAGAARVLENTGLEGQLINAAVALDSRHALLAAWDGRLYTFDGNTASPWPPQTEHQLSGRITAMERLVEGGVAIAIADTGIYLFSDDGALVCSLVLPEFRRIGGLAAREPGVLWVASENAVHRVLYDSPLTSFGQPLGITGYWPQVARWNNTVMICSSGNLYAMQPTPAGHLPTFRTVGAETLRRIEFIAASGMQLLATNPVGVFSIAADDTITPVIQIANVSGLRFVDDGTCFVIGAREIAALKQVGGRWVECAPRIGGVGDGPLHIESYKHEALWVEMGADRVGRLSLHDGALEFRRVELPWHGEQWTNVGVLGETIVLTCGSGQRAYYDEARAALCEAPALDRLLNRSPYWLLRMAEDASGTIWASHTQGIVTFTPDGKDYALDSTTFELRNDSYPSPTILQGNDIWIPASRTLYHVERHATPSSGRAHPTLVSLVNDRQHLELLSGSSSLASTPHFSYNDNSLSFRFFSGTYAWRSPPLYEYRLGRSEPWAPVDSGLMLHFPKLRDGSYLLEMRPAGPRSSDVPPVSLAFVIDPPWYRPTSSYAVYGLALLVSLVGTARWMNHRSLQRNAALARLVQERTHELEVTMEKLEDETRNAAILAERTRLAGELHDSLQQGLSGSILHLETTLTDPSLTREVSSQLKIMRSMLSYSRDEVQQVVWNLESPLLHNSTLGEALRKLAGYISAGRIEINVVAPAEPISLEQVVQHNLLRLAHEAITNAVKHAQATRIDVTLHSNAETVVLSVADNGKGFDPAACSRIEGHFGLRGMRMRARSIRGDLQIVSTPGNGSTITIAVHLKRANDHDPGNQI